MGFVFMEKFKAKEFAIKMIRSMPDDINIDGIIEELRFKMQVDKGLCELDEGKWISHKEVEQKVSYKWLKK